MVRSRVFILKEFMPDSVREAELMITIAIINTWSVADFKVELRSGDKNLEATLNLETIERGVVGESHRSTLSIMGTPEQFQTIAREINRVFPETERDEEPFKETERIIDEILKEGGKKVA
jgi:hypothetical protein